MPGILPNEVDNYLGAYVSDLFIIPASVVITCAFNLSWHTKILCVAILTGIDWWFTMIGVYEHHWWRSIYTGILLIPLYAIGKWQWTSLQTRIPPRLLRLLTIFLTYVPLHGTINFAANRGDQLYILQIASWHCADKIKITAILVTLHLFIVATIVALFIGLKMPFRYRAIGIGIIAMLNWAVGHFSVFVPHANITSHHLDLVPLVAIPLLIALFRIARLDYLFP
jgi:hypothetical protein